MQRQLGGNQDAVDGANGTTTRLGKKESRWQTQGEHARRSRSNDARPGSPMAGTGRKPTAAAEQTKHPTDATAATSCQRATSPEVATSCYRATQKTEGDSTRASCQAV